jgi:hypothetical protein
MLLTVLGGSRGPPWLANWQVFRLETLIVTDDSMGFIGRLFGLAFPELQPWTTLNRGPPTAPMKPWQTGRLPGSQSKEKGACSVHIAWSI